GYAPPSADDFFHDVAFDRSQPGVTPRAMRTNAPVKQPGVSIMLGLRARRPLLLTPFVLNANVRIREVCLCRDRPIKLARDMDGWPAVHIGNAKDAAGIVVKAERLFRAGQPRKVH